MHTLVIYDISNDRQRSKVAEACLDYGLDRIQFSAFYGNLNPTHQEELMLRIMALLDEETGKVQLIPVCERDWSNRMMVP